MDLNLCLKVLDAEQIRQADQFTIKNEPIHSIDLMERASEEFVRWFTAQFDPDLPVVIFCGTGNNGGDGLVICRLLNDNGYTVSLFCVDHPDSGSRDFKINYDFIQNYDIPQTVINESNFPTLGSDTVIIDAMFGSGLSRPITGVIADLINHLNAEPCEYRVAVDIASGLGCSNRYEGAVMNATHTVSFQVPKLSLLLPQNENQCGEVVIKSIGLVEEYIQSLSSNYYFSTLSFIRSFIRNRSKFSHKGKEGKNLLVAGGLGKIGAAVLAARACLRSGAGLLTMHAPGCGRDVLQSTVPEAMVSVDDAEELISSLPEDVGRYDVIGVGPGIGTDEKTAQAFYDLLLAFDRPMVIDADALNILSENKEWIAHVPAGSVLTPHPGEFKRLAGGWADDYKRLNKQIEFCKKNEVILLLKGAYTSICSPNGVVLFNSTGNSGMATGGSGDVLTGIITALLGQGYTGFESAALGAYLHGLSGDIFAKKNVEEALIASDLIEYLPRAFRKVISRSRFKKQKGNRRS